MFEYLNIVLQIFLFISILIFYFDKYKQRKFSQSLDVLEKDLDKIAVKEEIKQEKETVEYIYYSFYNLHLVETFIDSLVDINHYHWCPWLDKDKGTVISIDYQLGGDEWLDLYPNNYLVFNHTHKTFSYLTPQELSVEIHKDTKNYIQWMII